MQVKFLTLCCILLFSICPTDGETAAPIKAVTAPPAAPVHAQKPEETLRSGKNLFRLKEYSKAQTIFETLLKENGNPQSKIRHNAQLWLSKSLFMQKQPEKAAQLLEELLKNPSINGIDPATIVEAHYDLAACRYKLGTPLSAALDFLNVALSATPAGMQAIQEQALINTKLIACTSLDGNSIASLERIARTPDLQTFLLNARMQNYLQKNHTNTFLSTIPLVDQLLRSPSISRDSQQLIESLKKRATQLSLATFKERKIGILLPVEIPVYRAAERSSASNQMFMGIHQRLLRYQMERPDILISYSVAKPSEGAENDLFSSTKQLLETSSPLVLIGPMFSNDAIEAARAAKNSKVPLITPTATDNLVTDNNPWAFQLNPTHEERGRIAARELLKTGKPQRAAAIAEKTDNLEEMAKGFLDELKQAGSKSVIYASFSGKPEDQNNLAESLGTPPGTLLDALYLPMDSPETIETTLLFLEKNRIGYKRLLGSGVWSDRKVVERFRKKISKGITFFNDYSFSGSAIETVETAKSHQKLWNTALSSNFWYGYDTMDFLLHTIDKSPDLKHSELAKAIRNAPVYNAHYTKYRFEGNNVNHYLNVILIQPDTARQPIN
ncbi:MAG: ABC transporter substrate-binding protein [Chlorobium sp.]|jgi:ABC-type branched-subunit amino acid transport system substrate-binding protein|nr:ABC transporter substrate-binding protein [Chlorobium sp.]